MPPIDFFNFFRWVLGLVVTIYATILTIQSLWNWYLVLKGKEKHMSVLRRYLIVQMLRLRFQTFWGDLGICILLCLAFVIMWDAHQIIYQAGEQIAHARELAQPR